MQSKHPGTNERVPSAAADSGRVTRLRVAIRKGVTKQKVTDATRTNIHKVFKTYGLHALCLDSPDGQLQRHAMAIKPVLLAAGTNLGWRGL